MKIWKGNLGKLVKVAIDIKKKKKKSGNNHSLLFKVSRLSLEDLNPSKLYLSELFDVSL